MSNNLEPIDLHIEVESIEMGKKLFSTIPSWKNAKEAINVKITTLDGGSFITFSDWNAMDAICLRAERDYKGSVLYRNRDSNDRGEHSNRPRYHKSAKVVKAA